jgi:hypothetical protein
VEERTNDSPEKLSSDVYTFGKEDIRRTRKQNQGGRKGRGGRKDRGNRLSEADLNKGIKEAISEEIVDVITE